ncbi:hypothetical protein BJ138DRAFT_33730 [Hygrophoropsis aurantiaca]|uniref:Uncharacterized protein n=1 Tax=Hygrophoropsis aurantiaca TaxID=72124 RepID=A0ACB7ZTU3_9AGAM|nr:hypothetical protein BJ138DRAFT_33730 [Hygrophoropsis aurantiaca]
MAPRNPKVPSRANRTRLSRYSRRSTPAIVMVASFIVKSASASPSPRRRDPPPPPLVPTLALSFLESRDSIEQRDDTASPSFSTSHSSPSSPSSATSSTTSPSFVTSVYDSENSSTTLSNGHSTSVDLKFNLTATSSMATSSYATFSVTVSGQSRLDHLQPSSKPPMTSTTSVDSTSMPYSQSTTGAASSSSPMSSSYAASAVFASTTKAPSKDHDENTNTSVNESADSSVWASMSSHPEQSGATSSITSATVGRASRGPSAAPQQLISATHTVTTITTETTVSGRTIETTMTLSIGPVHMSPSPLNTGNTSPILGSNTWDRLLPEILIPVLGVLAMIVLGVTLSRCRARRRRKKHLTQSTFVQEPSSEYRRSLARTDWTPGDSRPMSEVVPNAIGRRILADPFSTLHNPDGSATSGSPFANSSQISEAQTTDPFADSSERASSRTSAPSIHSDHSTETVSTQFAFVTDSELGGIESAFSSGSLELNILSPVSSIGASSQSHYFSATGHYPGRPSPPSDSPLEKVTELLKEDTVVNESAPASPTAFFPLAGARLRALLDEARRG